MGPFSNSEALGCVQTLAEQLCSGKKIVFVNFLGLGDSGEVWRKRTGSPDNDSPILIRPDTGSPGYRFAQIDSPRSIRPDRFAHIDSPRSIHPESFARTDSPRNQNVIDVPCFFVLPPF